MICGALDKKKPALWAGESMQCIIGIINDNRLYNACLAKKKPALWAGGMDAMYNRYNK